MNSICVLCGETQNLSACGDGLVCESCAEVSRVGKDSTSRKARLMQHALHTQAENARAIANGQAVTDWEAYAAESSALLAQDDAPGVTPMVAHGEVVLQDQKAFRDTMTAPGVVAMDASAERLRLISQVGLEGAAMALDAADTIHASNSLERMAAHQLAMLHSVAMSYAHKAAMQPDTIASVKMLNLSIRAIETFQRGMLTIKRMRSTGEQKIVIERVNVEGGGQAVIGHVQHGGGGGK